MITSKYLFILFIYFYITHNYLVLAFDFNISEGNVEYDSFDVYNYQKNNYDSKYIFRNFNASALLPDDYKSMKNRPISRSTSHINETLAKLDRIYSWIKKLSESEDFKNIYTTIVNDVFESINESDINPDCLSSLTKIYDGVQRNEIWALKCNKIYSLKNFTVPLLI
jgi:hypothetical protein